MSLRIIKKDSAKTTEILPFFFAGEYAGKPPESPVWPEVTLADEFPPAPESPDTGAVSQNSPPPADIEQIEKEAFDRGCEEGYKRGYEEGRRAGEETADALIEDMTRRYTDSLGQAAELKNTLRGQAEKEVVGLALAIAKKIVHREVHVDPMIIQTLVRVALERVSGKSQVTVRLSHQDYEYMTRKRGELARVDGRDVNFVPDGSIARGGCLIQTENGDIDARIEEEFREIENVFFEGLK